MGLGVALKQLMKVSDKCPISASNGINCVRLVGRNMRRKEIKVIIQRTYSKLIRVEPLY